MTFIDPREKYFEFLYKLFEISHANSTHYYNTREKITEPLGFSQDDLYAAVSYLKNKRYVESIGSHYEEVRITSYGIDTVCEAMTNPHKSIRDFPPVNNIHLNIGTINGSNVQISQNSPGSKQIFNISESRYPEILEIIKEVDSHKNELKIDPSKLLELMADLETIKAQINSPSPKKNIIDSCWPPAKDLLIQAGAGVLSAVAYAKLSGL